MSEFNNIIFSEDSTTFNVLEELDVITVASRLATLSTQMADLTQSIYFLSQEILNVNASIGSLQNDLSVILPRVTNVENQVTSLHTTVIAATETISVLNNTVVQLQVLVNTFDQRITNLTDENIILRNQINSQSNTITALRNDYNGLMTWRTLMDTMVRPIPDSGTFRTTMLITNANGRVVLNPNGMVTFNMKEGVRCQSNTVLPCFIIQNDQSFEGSVVLRTRPNTTGPPTRRLTEYDIVEVAASNTGDRYMGIISRLQ